ncbi:MAG: TetR/AcrR family transcriptional regulator [Magnetovibrionaceae bacterium]
MPTAHSPGREEIAAKAIDAALNLAADTDWKAVALADIAEKANLALSELHPAFGHKFALISGYMDRIDRAVLDGVDPEDAQEATRDRLFDIMMRRFDELQKDRRAVASIINGTLADPLSAACLLGRAGQSMSWMLEAAGVPSHGMKGRLRTKALGLLHLTVLRVWLKDDSQDLSKTMAALDKALDKAERAEGWCNDFGWRKPGGNSTETTARPSEQQAKGGPQGQPA